MCGGGVLIPRVTSSGAAARRAKPGQAQFAAAIFAAAIFAQSHLLGGRQLVGSPPLGVGRRGVVAARRHQARDALGVTRLGCLEQRRQLLLRDTKAFVVYVSDSRRQLVLKRSGSGGSCSCAMSWHLVYTLLP